MCVCMCAYTHVYVQACMCMHTYVCVYVCVHMWKVFHHVGLGISHGCKYLVVYFTGLYHLF